MARPALLLLLLLAGPVLAESDSLLVLGEEWLAREELAGASSRWSLGASLRDGGCRERMQGELHAGPLCLLADRGSGRRPSMTLSLLRGDWALGAGAFSSAGEPLLLRRPRRRSSLDASPACRGPQVWARARAAPVEQWQLRLPSPLGGIRLGGGPDGSLFDLRGARRQLSLRLTPRGGLALLSAWSDPGPHRWQAEAALADAGDSARMALLFRGSWEGTAGLLAWEGLLLAGPRPESWSSGAWLGADRGIEARVALAGRGLRLGLRQRSGVGLPEGALRREASLRTRVTLSGQELFLSLRALEDEEPEALDTGLSQPRWQPRRERAGEITLRWRGGRLVLRRKGQEEGLLLRLERRADWAGLKALLRLTLHRGSEGFGSFLLLEGGRLGRRLHSLRGRGGRLSLRLEKKAGSWELRSDAALSTREPPALSLELLRSFGR